MTSPALALTPVPISGQHGGGSEHRTASPSRLRHHKLCENTDGNWGAGNWDASRAFAGRGTSCFPLPSDRRAPGQHTDRGGA
jgi:hypothetical protein